MKGSGAGWDSILYRVYIFGGLAGVVLVTVGTVIFFDPHGRTMLPVYTGGGCVTLFLLGIIGYWWIQILFAGYGGATLNSTEADNSPPEISALKSWTTLFEAMVKHGGNIEALELSRKKSGRPMLEWFAWATLLALFPIVNVWLYLFGVLSQESFLTYIRPAIIAIAVLMLIRTYFLFKSTERNDEETIYAPLGLRLVETSRAGTLLEGRRQGRQIHIRMDGRHYTTHVSGLVPRFEVESKDGKFLLPEDLPEDVHAALKGLRKAKRWRGVKLIGNANGITVEREARGLNLWLYDLWLGERLMRVSNG